MYQFGYILNSESDKNYKTSLMLESTSFFGIMFKSLVGII